MMKNITEPVMTKVVNLTNRAKHKDDVYIGRPSKWGNPFKIDRDGTREEVLEKYKEYVVGNAVLLGSLRELKAKTLACWCAPKACHSDVSKELIEEVL